MNQIRGLAELAADIKDQLPEKAPPRHERDPEGVAVESLLALHAACQKAHPRELPKKVLELTKQTTALLGRIGVKM
jgi:hypothetical protein